MNTLKKYSLIGLLILAAVSTGSAHTNISSGDDFIIQIADATGDIDAVFIDDTSIPMITSIDGGFEYREHFTNGTITAWYALQGSVTSHADNTVTYNTTHNDLDFNFTFTPCARQTNVSCEINDAQQVDRVIQIRYILPINATGWYWGEYINQHDLIGVGIEYSNTYLIGDTRKQNTYPFSSLNNSTIGMGIAIPMDVPRIYRIRYDTDAGGYSIEYDIGLANCTTTIGNSTANFTFIVYKADEPEWGFRAAAKKYYELYPEFFVKRNEREGTWICGYDPSDIPNASDFGFVFHDAHYCSPSRRVYDHQHEIYPMQYTEPFGWWRDFGDNSTEPSYNEKIVALINDSENGTGMWRDVVTTKFVATAALNTAPYDENGSQCLDYPYFWYKWGTWHQNYPEIPDPDIPSPNRYDISYAKYLRSNKSGVYAYNWTFGLNCSIDTIAHSGNYSGKIEILGTSDVKSGSVASDHISVTPLTTYNFSAWGKTLNCGGSNCPCVRVAEYDSSKTYITQKNLEFDFGTSGWAEKTIVFTTNTNTAYIQIYANFWNGYGTFWFDGVELYESGSGDNLVKNNGFESVYNASDYQCDGFRVDSLTTNDGWAKIENYRREHWKYVDHPLVFSYDTKQPVLLGTLSHYDCISAMHENMTDMGKRVDANIFSYAYSFYGNLIDVLGSEVWVLQMDDDDASLYRTMSYQKTNRNLVKWTRYGNDSITNEEMEIYMNSQMFYSMFPSITAASSDGGRYWSNATLYERDRDLFKKYIPIIKNVSAAGWEPIPYATCDNPDIRFERYGNTVGDIYFTIRGDSSTSENGNITVHTKTIGMQDNYFVVSDILTETHKLYFVANDNTTFAVSVDNNATSVYSLSSPTHTKAYYNTNSSIINTVNATGYIEYHSLYGDSGDMVCSSGSLKVTT